VSLIGLRSSLGDQAPQLSEILARAGAPGFGADLVAPPAARPFILAALADALGVSGDADRPVVVAVTASVGEAQELAAGVDDLLGGDSAMVFPGWETLPHERLSPSADTVGQRIDVLRRLVTTSSRPRVITMAVRALLQPFSRELSRIEPVTARAGDEIDLDAIAHRLVEFGYVRADLVERRGQFAMRGGILDVFAPTAQHPVRIELFGDVVEEVREFSVADQRSLADVPEGLHALPVREVLLTDQIRRRAEELSRNHPQLAEIASKIAEGRVADGMETLTAALVDDLVMFVDLMPAGSALVICDPERVRSRAEDLVATSQEFLEASWHAAAAGGVAPLDMAALESSGALDLSGSAYRDLLEVETSARARGIGQWATGPFGLFPDAIELPVEIVTPYRGVIADAVTDIRRWIDGQRAVVVVAEGHGSAERLAISLRDEGLPAHQVEDLDAPPPPGEVTVTTARLSEGLQLPGIVVLTEADLLGERTQVRDLGRMPSRRRRTIDPLQLTPGDFIVHEQHGVGRYVEMVQRTVAGATREYLVLEYASSKRGQPADRLYVPTDQLDQVTRYVGGEAPSLHRLGGSDWQRTKSKARRAVREIAGELIRLYAARTATKGRSFGPDTPWQHELEDAFPYVETPDQLACIDEVKLDMQRGTPMDRVICGDVGYGKTEIAVRAAFKAVQDGAQVAVLVPTTLLVQQHLATFTRRYAPFPITVAGLSRFNTDAEAKKVVAGLADGSIDIVIGTHRLLTPQVRFKDLGLLIVDEEQRFGVEHKEHIKALRTSVDVLTMSATPIPRTLEMSLTGIREMSTITTPPEERLPVLTYVGPYDDRQIAAAIRRELIRDGQVFFVHNRVASIDRAAARVGDLVPEARVAVAHGQMNEHELERIVVQFWEGEIDVLVCTTIVENGIDIANANTLIVDRADTLGLSQLHQLRGRVGRGRERGYAYFCYPPEQPLSETAYERLSTIAQHNDLGAGMQIAMKDLEIRGAGNLLGGEQSGHIAEVGFDLYVRMVGEALAAHRGEAAGDRVETRVELPVDAHIPHDYIGEERLRLEAYRRLADAHDDEAIDGVAEELVDRYGSLPAPVERLLAVARFRARAQAAGLEEVVLQGRSIRMHPVELAESAVMRLTRLYPGTSVKPAVRTILLPRPMTATVGGAPVGDLDLLEWATGVVDTIAPVPSATTGSNA
jgi:transcription-repair coupling factor (superfamily II helicase)